MHEACKWQRNKSMHPQVISTAALFHSSDLSSIKNAPHQPRHFKLPKCPFGKRTIVDCYFDCW